ncbi:MAG: uracil-DNA glycosylase [Bacteroidales bacterium]|nr:uracil-DNA glycosylase [Bacteroidales bacterium]
MTYNTPFLDSRNSIDKSWNDFLSPDIIEEIKSIESAIVKSGKDFTPDIPNVLRFLCTPLQSVKVIIIGQDPYPQKGAATGRAFEVGTLKSWNEKYSNISLKNIIRAIYYAHKKVYLKYSEIKPKLEVDFQLKPPYELFVNWEQQGVLLLNTSFTCETGNSNSHEKLWKNFTIKLLEYLAGINSDIIWFLWGNNAKSIVNNIEIKNKIESMHPMMCYNKPGRDDDFLFGKINPFFETKDLVNWLG